MRINDVSKNHQRQRFRILVTPDTGQDPLLHDVGADATQAIEVKSKRRYECLRGERRAGGWSMCV